MNKFAYVLMAVLLLALVPGCGSDKDVGKNRHKDLPRSGPTEAAK
jgi:hypothetical protein